MRWRSPLSLGQEALGPVFQAVTEGLVGLGRHETLPADRDTQAQGVGQLR